MGRNPNVVSKVQTTARELELSQSNLKSDNSKKMQPSMISKDYKRRKKRRGTSEGGWIDLLIKFKTLTN